MPTAPAGPWLQQAIAKGLIRPDAIRPAVVPTGTVTPVNPLLATPAPDCSEADFQAAVKELAEANGWLFFHPHDSRKSEPGYPDCTAVRVGADGRGELIFAELKAAAGAFTPEQRLWLRALEAVAAVKVFRWRPADWPEVVKTLTAK